MSLVPAAHHTRGRFRPREAVGKLPQAQANVRLNRDLREYVAAANRSENTNHWNERPEVPSPDEIMGEDLDDDASGVVELVPNLIRGPWPAVHTYLKAHYELLREDAVSPLRDAVAYFKNTPSMEDSPFVSIYEKV